MKKITVLVAVAMLAMSGVAGATNDKNPCGNSGNNCQPAGGNGGNGGTGGAGGHGGEANAGAAAGAAAGAVSGSASGAAVLGSGNSASSVVAPVTNTNAVGTGVGNFSPESDSRSSVGNVTSGPSTATVGNVAGGAGGSANVGGVGNASGFGSTSFSPEANANNTNLNTDVNTNTVAVAPVIAPVTTSVNTLGQQQGQVALGGESSSSVTVAEGAFQGSQSQTAVSTVAEGAVQSTQTQSASATVAEGAVATSQTQTATGGTVEQGAVANSVDVNVTVEQPVDERPREIAPVVKNVLPAASAAPSFASICTAGMAGQSTSYGISLATTSATCRHLMAADALMAIGDREKAIKHVYAASKHASVKGFMSYITTVVTLGIIE